MECSLLAFGRAVGDYPVIARAAEDMGFELLWIADHLVGPVTFESRGHDMAPATPFVDVWVEIGYLAALTSTLRFGSGILILPMRDPFTVAKAVATAQQVSRGRVLVGFGVGWMPEEFAAVGADFADRGARTDEMIEVMRGLWSGKPFAFEGRWHRFAEVLMMPPPEPPVPLIGGGGSAAALRRAARAADGWLGLERRFDQSVARSRELARLLEEGGRDVAAFTYYARVDDVTELDRYREYGFTHTVLTASPAVELSRLLDRMAAFSAAALRG